MCTLTYRIDTFSDVYKAKFCGLNLGISSSLCRISLRACENRWLGPTSRVPYPVGLWGGQEPAFLTHSQVMVMLLTQRPHLENDCLRVYLKELG